MQSIQQRCKDGVKCASKILHQKENDIFPSSQALGEILYKQTNDVKNLLSSGASCNNKVQFVLYSG